MPPTRGAMQRALLVLVSQLAEGTLDWAAMVATTDAPPGPDRTGPST